MNYYVKLSSGVSIGPVPQREADRLMESNEGAHLYDEEAFFKLMPTVDEVKELLAEMESVEEAAGRGVLFGVVVEPLLRKARGAINSLSAKKLVTGVIEGGVLQLDSLPEGVEVDIRDYDTTCVDEEDQLEDEKGRNYFNAGH